MKPRIFIGSSKESVKIAEKVKSLLDLSVSYTHLDVYKRQENYIWKNPKVLKETVKYFMTKMKNRVKG